MDDELRDWIGRIVDSRYRILALIGRGGMGTVFRAEHQVMRRTVALKVLNPEFHRLRHIAERFQREAFATARLAHPNCVHIADCGNLEDGTPYLVMELLEGTSLADELERHGRVPARRALGIMRHVLAGLDHAHSVGVVHRDVKPENIFLVHQRGDRDFAKLVDFGIAKLLGDAIEAAGGGHLTQSGSTIGSPLYMSPEQAFGGTLDGRSDIYSATLVLYRMLAGRLPFDGPDKMAVIRMHLTAPVPPVAQVAPGVVITQQLEELLFRGLAKEPGLRWQSAQELLGEVERLLASDLESLPAATPPVPPAQRPTRDLRSPVTAGAAAEPVAPAALPTAATVPLAVITAAEVVAPLPASAPQMPDRAATASRPHDGPPPPASPRTEPAVSSVSTDRRGGWQRAAVLGGVLLAGVGAAVSLPRGGTSEPGRPASGPPAPAPEPQATRVPAPAPAAVAGTGSGGAATARAARAPAEEPVPGLEEVRRLARTGGHPAAVKRLLALAKKHPRNALIPYTLGNICFDRLWWGDGFAAYSRAIALDPAYRNDERLIDDAIKSLMSNSQHARGARFIARELGQAAVPQLRQAARSARSLRVRERAARLLRTLTTAP
jgi:serine/threonine-protein kinase